MLYNLWYHHTYRWPSRGTECSETSAYKIQTPGNYPEESIQHSDHGESSEIKNNVIIFKKNTTAPRPNTFDVEYIGSFMNE